MRPISVLKRAAKYFAREGIRSIPDLKRELKG